MLKQKELKFDLEQLNEMKLKLADVATELEEYKKKVVDSLENLKKNWNTAAGKRYMEKVDTGWTAEVDKYIEIVRAVEGILEEAQKQYMTVEDEIDKLKFYS